VRTVDLILKKKYGGELTPEEIQFLISGYVADEIPDYQLSAWMMACCWQGLTDAETAVLTRAMCDSGETFHLDRVEGTTVDKHSTGGVGDKTTLSLAPLLAHFGLKVAKMSGRGLGHTGGTLDKLDSVPGFHSDLDEGQFFDAVNASGVAICAQTKDLVPADKRLYALRDVTGTVDQIGLIAASIMSKKLAFPNDALVLDVKVGRGAFMKDLDDARELARQMVSIGVRNGRKLSAVLSDMDAPLGSAIGNALEVREAAETLRGEGPEDFTELVAVLCGHLLELAGEATSADEGAAKAREALSSGAAYPMLEAFLEGQGAEKGALDRLPEAPDREELTAESAGFVTALDALEVGVAAMELGAGRATKDDEIDLAVGLELLKKPGDPVAEGDALVRLHHRSARGLEGALARLRGAYEIGAEAPEGRPLVFGSVGAADVS
jgi:pyrimidine-nucleoside phosphorylase